MLINSCVLLVLLGPYTLVAKAEDIHRTVTTNDPASIQAALDAGEDINKIGHGGQTPLMFAVLNGHARAVEFLISAGADTSIPEKDGYTPMHGAGFQGRAEIAKMLIDHGLDPHDVHEDGFTPFHRALWGRTPGHTHTVEVFLKAGASPTQTGGYPPAEPINMAATPATKKLLKRWMKEASSKPEKAEL